ncbi:hypothetical protein I4U23_012295 [Adineta vaga]|nr:hypothetical protein I4U23_012295 [Adineta vaga]
MFLYSGQTFNNLRSLVVFLSMDTGYYQLQLLLDQTKYLYSLKIISNNKVHHSLFHLTNQSIRRLDLMKCSMDGLDYFDEEECKQLIDSSLGKQCEVLLIRIFNRETILHFIHKMTNLRLLILEWKKDSKILKYFKCQNDELLEWLRNHLLTTCSIVRDQKSPSRVQIWINRREFLSNSHILVLKDRRKFFRSIKSTFPRLFRKSSFYQ